MTHSHDEDLAICEALLAHPMFGWAGVIGSGPKTKRFRQRLLQRGFSAAAIARLTMPIGVAGIASKEPAAIAVAVAAQLLQLREARARGREAPAESDGATGIARES
jgi:xanthine dehydrogenase accessory factor